MLETSKSKNFYPHPMVQSAVRKMLEESKKGKKRNREEI